MKKSFRMVLLCAAVVAAVWTAALLDVTGKVGMELRFRAMTDRWRDVMDMDGAKDYVREKLPVIRWIFEKLMHFLGTNG